MMLYGPTLVDNLFNFSKLFEDVLDIIKIAEDSLANGYKRNSGGTLQQGGLSQNMFEINNHKKFGPPHIHKCLPKEQLSTRMALKERNHPLLDTK